MTGDANYKGVDLSFEKRFSNGYSYRASYTLGERARPGAGAPERVVGPAAERARPRGVGRRRATSTSATASSPTSSPSCRSARASRTLQDGVAGKILGGWLVSGIYSARSGRPMTVTQGNNNVGAGMTGLPNLTGDPQGAETVEQWYNPAAFTQVPSGTFGNAGRNILRGPGWVTFDMSVQRRINFSDRVNATLRWDIFNMFNRANFGLPQRDITSATAGVISDLAGDPRVMQLSLRLGF